MAFEGIGLALLEGAPGQDHLPVAGVEHDLPFRAGLGQRQDEGLRVLVGVEQDEEGLVPHRAPLVVDLLDGVTGQVQPEEAALPVVPLLFGHLAPLRMKPGEVLDGRAVDAAALKETPAPEHGMIETEPDESSREVAQALARLRGGPGEPGELAVLAIGVVVAALTPPQLVAAREHGHALGEEEGGEEAPLPPLAERAHGGIGGGAFATVVGGVVLVAAVAIVLPVRLVALLRVGDEVGEGEAVVGGDEVDARVGSASTLLVEIAGAGEAIGELGNLAGIALPVAADGVAI